MVRGAVVASGNCGAEVAVTGMDCPSFRPKSMVAPSILSHSMCWASKGTPRPQRASGRRTGARAWLTVRATTRRRTGDGRSFFDLCNKPHGSLACVGTDPDRQRRSLECVRSAPLWVRRGAASSGGRGLPVAPLRWKAARSARTPKRYRAAGNNRTAHCRPYCTGRLFLVFLFGIVNRLALAYWRKSTALDVVSVEHLHAEPPSPVAGIAAASDDPRQAARSALSSRGSFRFSPGGKGR